MAEFTSYEPEKVEVMGEVINSFVMAFPAELREFGRAALDDRGLGDVDGSRFYRAQPFLDALKEVALRVGRNMMMRIGEGIALSVALPPELNNLQGALKSLDRAYHSKYRGGHIGNWKYREEGMSGGLMHGGMISTNHYCCAFDRGVLEGFAKRFRPPGVTDVLVRHEDSEPCRKMGADSCTYVISWG
jgi:hypothetical protein